MKVVHVVPHIDKEAAGPSYTVPRLCDVLVGEGNDVTLMTLKATSRNCRFKLELYPQWEAAAKFGISHLLARALGRYSHHVDVIHNHSLWSMTNIAAGWVAIGHAAKFVNSPHGALSPWALSHHSFRKKIFWPLQKRALAKADLIHVTGEAEFQDVRDLGFVAPIVVLPNGIDIPEKPKFREIKVGSRRILLFLGRLHPVKGIDNLVKAWSNLENKHLDWELRIVGIGERRYQESLNNLIHSLRAERCTICAPLYGEKKSEAFFSADLFVLATHSENFGIAVAESLAHGCPAIVTKAAPWKGLESNDCGWWIENDLSALEATLTHAMSLPVNKLKEMGSNGREWMRRDFSWSAIGEKMNMAYEWLRSGEEKPKWVRT